MSQPLMGKPLDRTDGPRKVSGGIVYTADHSFEGMLHAVVVTSAIARGRIRSIDDTAAGAVHGVVGVMTHENAPRVDPAKQSDEDTLVFVLQNDQVEFDRQPVAVVVAETFEQATHAAGLVRVTYDAATPGMDLAAAPIFTPDEVQGKPAGRERGAPQPAFDAAAVRVRQTYRTPTEHHNPMETHATIAQWDGDQLTLHDATQWAFGVQRRLADIFGIDSKNVTVMSPFIGGAFGCKGTAWSHVPLAAMASKMFGHPVKLVVTRPQMFGWVGHRPQTVQTVSLAADSSGQLQSVIHEVQSETSISDEFVEPCGVFSRDLYAVPNYAMSHELRRLNISKPTFQRGPGESTGSFAMESAMDELAYALKLDPLELRLRNYSENNPDSGKPYTSKNLRECYLRAAERFEWNARNPAVRSMQRGRMLVGIGMSSASRATHRSAASTRIHMDADGAVTIQCGTIEQGTGSSTVYSQLAAEILEIPFERVTFEFGDTTLPDAPIAAGSQTAASVGSAVAVAAAQLHDRLAALGGHVPAEGIELLVNAEPAADEENFAQQAFGANFAEVEVDPDLCTVRVTRFVGAYEAGRILNEKTARSQLLGGIVWGISMALFEETRYDRRTGRIMNASLADYLVPTNADIPDPEIIIVEEDDAHVNPAHVKGIGEVGICGSGAAVANAIYHATGVRVRELPITLEKLIG